MRTPEDIESYLIRMDAGYELLGQNIWVTKDTGADLVVSISGPMVIFRVKVLDQARVPKATREEFYRKLLELNATEMLHGAYGLEEGAVVVTAAHELENLDFNEFQATLDDIGMAVSKHYPILSRLAA
ncbi:MAG: hypothetical protein IT371_04315 [Deltaproteobacteria bacterium]|nr:hypothetical protein [Deltaproteobacteria bacterium]